MNYKREGANLQKTELEGLAQWIKLFYATPDLFTAWPTGRDVQASAITAVTHPKFSPRFATNVAL
jgi:hypothetical protein